jgi:hypothetical protein
MNLHNCVCGHRILDHEPHYEKGMRGASGQGKGYCTMIDEDGVRCECWAYEKPKEKKVA